MADTEKQEGQKTVVAFIAGLLIGGLLVWVFSASPENAPADDAENTNTEMTEDTDDTNANDNEENTNTSTNTSSASESNAGTQPTTGEGSIAVANQGAGSSVVLESVEYPGNAGWIVVRDYVNSTPGRILGAARFNVTDGLTPESINLLRATEAGKTYQVSYHSENGDKVFDLDDDAMIEGITDTFTAN